MTTHTDDEPTPGEDLNGESDEAFCDAYYASHLDHAWKALRDGVPYQVNVNGALALIQQVAADLRLILSRLASQEETIRTQDARLHVIRNEKCKRCALTRAECADAIAEIEIGRLSARQENP